MYVKIWEWVCFAFAILFLIWAIIISVYYGLERQGIKCSSFVGNQ